MIALAKPKVHSTEHHDRFLDMLPTIRRCARQAFDRHDAEAREEAVQEVIANAWRAFVRLVERGRAALAYPTVLARYAIAQVRGGRKVGTRLRVVDVSSEYARIQKGFTLDRLDEIDASTGEWQEVLVEDGHATPADIAASRIDFAAWLRTLPGRTRKIAKLLATGETTNAAAKKFAVSAGRVSQLRRELQDSWTEFVGDRQELAAA